MQFSDAHVAVGRARGSGLSSLPVSRLPDPNVSAVIPGDPGPCTEKVKRFLPADALWNLAMAINVYMTLFHKYNAQQLKTLEWRYHLMVRAFQTCSLFHRPNRASEDRCWHFHLTDTYYQMRR